MTSMQHSDLPTILDIEASGLGKGSYPIEVGYVLPNGSAYCTLIAPQPEWTQWDKQAAGLHGIGREQIERCGKPVQEVAQHLNTVLAGQTVYTDAWANDYSWLNALFEAANAQPRFKLESLRSLLTEEQAAVWHSIKEQVQHETALVRHRASTDAKLLQLTLQRLRRQAPITRRQHGDDLAYGVGLRIDRARASG
ncbi:hypothetical protein KIK84_14825 [Curvibacter sp. CHRR-16]|uniref:hypothetical protein n=1 Tax=Curvibacter sp. CHRR-16 TaxID=2835872 RepID=UPI001BDB1F4A|nr:hypothetical protein [Curvibacter sp. CHRR-16]MBT0571599.1 hypothetical protein [Curvibacter sp. CHRR-16]